MAIQNHTTESTHVRDIPQSTQLLYEEMVALGGGIFRALWDAEMTGFEPIVLFDSPQTKTTLGLRISKMSADAVRREIRESNKIYGIKENGQ